MSDEQQQKIELKEEEEKMEKKVEEKPATAKFAKSAKMVFLPSKNGKLQQITFTGKLNIKKKEKTPPKKAKTPPKTEQPQKIDIQQNEQKIENEKKNISFSQNDQKEMTPPIKSKTPPKQVEFYLGYDKFKLFEHIQDIQCKLKSAKEQYRKNKIEEYQNLQRIEQEEKRKRLMKMKQDEIIEREPFRSGTTSQKQLFSDFQGFQKQFEQNKKWFPKQRYKIKPIEKKYS
ncbi:hypothetical protein PPERSA_02070 [Pseudocohnilembus persalinus]|uniref:Uncharacterized protein n=1 Tax=Pseudocohnilembus persalinus TaxID=266149 RepID=A0A0V0QFC4_PSEPJ|nr:hypothetical protein PPERSA_02070 [Pseudocohnilembus persalinus]|eukprot:KRX00891.1 hypothetical protein PPERSA_02070 [Pseudocohnilembus persalinus]